MGVILTLLCLIVVVEGGGIFKTPISVKIDEPLILSQNGAQIIQLEGQVTGTGNWHITLADGGTYSCDTLSSPTEGNLLLHITSRENFIVRNSRKLKVGWGTEENSGGLPVGLQKMLNMNIVCEKNYFQIFINGDHYASFAHRFPMENAQHLIICGPLEFQKIQIINPLTDACVFNDGCCTTVNHINLD